MDGGMVPNKIKFILLKLYSTCFFYKLNLKLASEGTAPTCINTSFTTVDQSCSALDVPLHGNLLNQRSSLDGRNTILNYSCKEGYKLVSQNNKKRNNGDLRVFCDKGRWNPSLQPAPVCQRNAFNIYLRFF